MAKFAYICLMGFIITDIDGPGGTHDDGGIFEQGDRFSGKFQITREGTLDEDLQVLLLKHKGTPSEVLVHQMIDSLIIFRHNYNQLIDGVFLKDGEKIDVESDPNLRNDQFKTPRLMSEKL